MSQGVACGLSPQFITEVLHGCLRRSLFDKRVFEMFGVITSVGIQRRFIRMVSKSREVIPIISEYWLLNVDDKKDVPAAALGKLAFNSVSRTENPVSRKENPVSRTGNTRNQSKVNQSKVNQIKSKQTVSRRENRDDDLDDDIKELFEKIERSVTGRPLKENEREAVRTLADRYGIGLVREGIETAASSGGHSVSYVGKCVETAASRKPSSGYMIRSDTDYAELERLLDEEWLAQFEEDDDQ